MEKYYLCSPAEDKFIAKDRSWVTDVKKAWLFDERHKAENVMISNLGKKTLKVGTIEVEEKEPKLRMSMVDSIETLCDEEVPINFIDTPLPFNLQEKYQEFIKMPALIDNEEKRLKAKLIKVSRAITDVAHYLEFSNDGAQYKLNASQRTKISVWESKLYAKRREIKDNLRIIEAFKGFYREDGNLLNSLSERHYSPRVLDSIFETGELPDFEEWFNEESN